MIQEAYVSFEVAKLLKEKGFKEITQGYINADQEVYMLPFQQGVYELSNKQYPYPTHQMVVAWLREEYEISIEISALKLHRWVYTIYRLFEERVVEVWNDGTYVSYEDATDGALKYCLENLNKLT